MKQEKTIQIVWALIYSEKPKNKKTTPPPDIPLAPYLALSLTLGRCCCHCRSKQISHYRIWSYRQVQIFNLLDIFWASVSHRHISQITSLKIHTQRLSLTGLTTNLPLIWHFCRRATDSVIGEPPQMCYDFVSLLRKRDMIPNIS